MRFLPLVASFVAGLSACGGTTTPKFTSSEMKTPSPLGDSYVLIPLPNEDQSLLGRVLPGPPEPGRELEELSRPNPCGEHLSEPRETPLANTFEDAQYIAGAASAGAILGTFGFSGDVQHATHFVYQLRTSSRVAVSDTVEYENCCKQNDCGFGFVSALIHGNGEYATGEETSASGSINVAFASAEGRTRLKVLHRRNVNGYLAAMVRVTNAGAHGGMTPFGHGAQLGITEETLSDIVKPSYERAKINVETRGNTFVLRDGTGEVITENEFIRRYRDVTGSEEADALESRRNWGLLAPMLVVTTVAVGGIATGIGLMATNDGDDAQVGIGAYTTVASGVVLHAVGIPTTILTTEWAADGSVTDHRLSELDARILAAEHNRTLLRRSVEKVQQKHSASGLSAQPVFGLGELGLHGTF